jgi:hypothetical protein
LAWIVLLRIFATVVDVPIAPPSTPPLMSKMLFSTMPRDAAIGVESNSPNDMPAPKSAALLSEM